MDRLNRILRLPRWLDVRLLTVYLLMAGSLIVLTVHLNDVAGKASTACRATARFTVQLNGLLNVAEDGVRKSAVLSPADKASRIAAYEQLRFDPLRCS